jgi:hypothetical protein
VSCRGAACRAPGSRQLCLLAGLSRLDCSGDPGANGAKSFGGGADNPSLSGQEWLVVAFDFGLNNSAGGFGSAPGSSSSANVAGGFNPNQHVVAGVSSQATDSISTFRCCSPHHVRFCVVPSALAC